MKLSQITKKDVINEQEGVKLGRIHDLEIDPASGKILNIKIQTNSFRNLITTKSGIEIPWNKIIKIGNDVIIVVGDSVYNQKVIDN
jgi:YlmC/YmxH family sporulation protein